MNKDLSSDIIAAYNYLLTRKEINPEKIGLIGHSKGGFIGAMVAIELPKVAFLVTLASPGLNGCETLYYQVDHIGNILGLDAGLIKKYQTNEPIWSYFGEEESPS